MQCIRCGRTISEGRLFCDTCAQTVRTPLDEAESRRLVLPDRNRTPPAPKPVKKSEPTPPPRSLRRLTAWVVALSLVCFVLMGAVGLNVYFYFNKDAVQERSRMALTVEENTRLNAEIDRMEEELTTALEEQKVLEDARQADAQKILRLEDELRIYQMQTGDLETDMSAMEEETLRLIGELERSATENRELNQRITEMQAQMQQADDETAYLEQMAAFVRAHLALVSDDGTGYYHQYGCVHFHTDAAYWIYGIAAAVESGYTPCPYCH